MWLQWMGNTHFKSYTAHRKIWFTLQKVEVLGNQCCSMDQTHCSLRVLLKLWYHVMSHELKWSNYVLPHCIFHPCAVTMSTEGQVNFGNCNVWYILKFYFMHTEFILYVYINITHTEHEITVRHLTTFGIDLYNSHFVLTCVQAKFNAIA